jgi:ribonucleoside-diphosphate reductase alpha chain
MEIFNAATDIIKNAGRRRIANMVVLNVWHLDILSFIRANSQEGVLSDFNISIMVNDKFMDRVSREMYDAVWVIHPYISDMITVGHIWSAIVGVSRRTGSRGYFSMTK